MESNFNQLKEEILRRAKEARACTGAYKRAYASNGFSELMQVIKDNFHFAARNKIIDPALIESCKDQFNANKIYCNEDIAGGFLLAHGNATVEAHGNVYITSFDMIECKLSENAIHRIRKSNTIRYASDIVIFEKQA